MENLEEIKRVQAAGMDVAAVERMKFMMLRHTDSGRLLAEDAGPVRLYFNHVDYKDMSESLYGTIYFDFETAEDGCKATYVVKYGVEEYYRQLCALNLDPAMRNMNYTLPDSPLSSEKEIKGTVKPAYRDGLWYLVRGNGHKINDNGYTYIKELGEGYFVAERGALRNVLRRDGSEVLSEWFRDVYDIRNGYFTIGVTVNKTKTTPTRYLYGLAHVSGDILYPPIFEGLAWNMKGDSLHACIDGKMHYFGLDGGVRDAFNDYLPYRLKVDSAQLIEKIVSWTMHGLSFFFRDTDEPVDTEMTYRPGRTLRAGIFLNAAHHLLRPVHKTRFLIASAHAVRQKEEYVFHCDSFFRVMDVYRLGNVVQVLLLHVPPSAIWFPYEYDMAVSYVEAHGINGSSLIAAARRNLERNINAGINPLSLDPEWTAATRQLPGEGAGAETYVPDTSDYGRRIHYLAHDEDISGFVRKVDKFRYLGIEDTVCEDCIFSRWIMGNGECCGRLLKEIFRQKYVSGQCEFKKTGPDEPSEYERREAMRLAEEKEKREKISGEHARGLLQKFTAEHLGGDQAALSQFDLYTLREFQEYGDPELSRAPLVQAVLSLAYRDRWPGLDIYSIERRKYAATKITLYQNLLGVNILDEYFKGLRKFDPDMRYHSRALLSARLSNTIGNLIILPADMSGYLEWECHNRIDRFLAALLKAMRGDRDADRELLDILRGDASDGLIPSYFSKGENGFHQFVHEMMLEDFVAPDGSFIDPCCGVWPSRPGLTAEGYLAAVERFCGFCERVLLSRAKRMVAEL